MGRRMLPRRAERCQGRPEGLLRKGASRFPRQSPDPAVFSFRRIRLIWLIFKGSLTAKFFFWRCLTIPGALGAPRAGARLPQAALDN